VSWRSKGGGEAGVSLAEVVVALAILTTVLVSLGGLMVQTARQTRQSAAAGYRAAAAMDAAAWAEGLWWDSIGSAIGCGSDTVGQYAYTRCLSVQDTGSYRWRLKQLRVVIQPTGALSNRPDTVIVYRNSPRRNAPLYRP
jgi:hypothetical protein